MNSMQSFSRVSVHPICYLERFNEFLKTPHISLSAPHSPAEPLEPIGVSPRLLFYPRLAHFLITFVCLFWGVATDNSSMERAVTLGGMLPFNAIPVSWLGVRVQAPSAPVLAPERCFSFKAFIT